MPPHYRTYYVDRIDDASSEQLTEEIRVASDDAAKQTALAICREKGWSAAEVWDKEADVCVTVVRVSTDRSPA